MFNTKPWQNDSVVVNVLSWIRTVVIINLSGFVAKTTKEPRKLKTCFPSVPTCRIFSSWNDFIHTWGLQYKLRPLPKIQNGKERWSAHACMWKRNRRTSQLFDFESKQVGQEQAIEALIFIPTIPNLVTFYFYKLQSNLNSNWSRWTTVALLQMDTVFSVEMTSFPSHALVDNYQFHLLLTHSTESGGHLSQFTSTAE